MSAVWVMGGSRTPIGKFLGEFAGTSAPSLAATSIRHSLWSCGAEVSSISEAFIGNVVSAGGGQAPARQAVRFAGLPDSVSSTMVNKVCGSGLQAVILAARTVQTGGAQACIAAGMESMSQAPHLIRQSRTGVKFGSYPLLDAIDYDGLRCATGNVMMGNYADKLAKTRSISRADQDAWALLSHRRACEAIDRGWTEQEIAPVFLDIQTAVRRDACPRPDSTIEKLSSLKPAFGVDGTVTAGNASGLADGAASVLVVDESIRRSMPQQSAFRILSTAQHSQAPEDLFTAPVGSILKVCKSGGVSVGQVDIIEINEAFAVQVLACIDELKLSAHRVNVHGGAIAYGHPIGCSGTRILVTLMHAMKRSEKRLGIASLCIGGGEAVAVLIEHDPGK